MTLRANMMRFGMIYTDLCKDGMALKPLEEWTRVVIDTGLLEKKYRDNKFVFDMIVAILAELEKVSTNDKEVFTCPEEKRTLGE